MIELGQEDEPVIRGTVEEWVRTQRERRALAEANLVNRATAWAEWVQDNLATGRWPPESLTPAEIKILNCVEALNLVEVLRTFDGSPREQRRLARARANASVVDACNEWVETIPKDPRGRPLQVRMVTDALDELFHVETLRRTET
jgi:hypothetical protein